MTWTGDISLDRILPVGCDRPLEPYQRLVAEGLMPVLLIVAGTAVSVILGGARYLRRRRRKRRKTVRTVLMHELKRVLPWLLPFSYLCSTSMATQAFSVFDCHAYGVNDATGAARSYLASDLRVRCDVSEADYRVLRSTAFILIACVSALPLFYFVLLWNCRRAIRTHSPSKLSRVTRFLWAECAPIWAPRLVDYRIRMHMLLTRSDCVSGQTRTISGGLSRCNSCASCS